MNALDRTLLEISTFLEKQKIPYMVIGGVALAVWKLPRATLDVDVAVWASGRKEGTLIRRLAAEFKSRVSDPAGFVRDTRVLPLETTSGRVDVVFGDLPFQRRALRRAKRFRIAGKQIRFSSIEDLILLKIASERAKDQIDVRELLRVHRAGIDRKYLDPLIGQLAEALSRPELLRDYTGMVSPK